jgi:hypothetical protein
MSPLEIGIDLDGERELITASFTHLSSSLEISARCRGTSCSPPVADPRSRPSDTSPELGEWSTPAVHLIVDKR